MSVKTGAEATLNGLRGQSANSFLKLMEQRTLTGFL